MAGYEALIAKWQSLAGTPAERLAAINTLMVGNLPWWQVAVEQGGGGLASLVNGWDLFIAGLLDASPALLATMHAVAVAAGQPQISDIVEFQEHYQRLAADPVAPVDHLFSNDAYHAAWAAAIAEVNALETP